MIVNCTVINHISFLVTNEVYKIEDLRKNEVLRNSSIIDLQTVNRAIKI